MEEFKEHACEQFRLFWTELLDISAIILEPEQHKRFRSKVLRLGNNATRSIEEYGLEEEDNDGY